MGTAARLHNAFWEYYLGIDTRGVVWIDKPDGVQYSALPYAPLFKVLQKLNPGPETAFVDVGCGKARTVCCAARMGFGKVAGIEYHPELAATGRRNLSKIKPKDAEARIIHAPAEACDYGGYNAFFFNNPFGRDTMRAVVRRMLEGARPGTTLTVAYLYPLYRSEFEDVGFTPVEEWKAPRYGLNHDAVFMTKQIAA